jgi:alpha-glucosidase (family GH31 glycosyl hydrolase)
MKSYSNLPTLKLFLFTLLLFQIPYLSQAQYSLDFDGDEDYVALNGADIPPPWTLEVMVNKNETDNYQHLLTGNDGNSGIRLEQYWGTKIGFTHAGIADWYFNYIAPIGQWKQVTITNNGTDTKLFINGILNSSVNASINFPMKWISKNTEYASLKSKIDELRIWDIVLSDDVILQYANQPIGPDHPNYNDLQHYYKFDEGSGNICHDSKGNLNGIIYGATYYIDTNHDVGIKQLIAPAITPDNYSAEESLIVRVKNYGFQEISEDFLVGYLLEGSLQQTITVAAGTNPLQPNETVDIEFAPIDLNTSGSYHFQFFTSLSNDENMSNDTLTKTLVSNSHVIANISNFQVDTNTVLITCGSSKVRVVFYKDNMFRIWLAPSGNFSNPAGDHIVVSYSFPLIDINWSDEGDHYLISTDSLSLHAYKNPLKFELYKSDNETLVWSESQGLDYGTRTFQYLNSDPDEFFYGGGMQNGYFSHKGNKIKISKETQNWDDGAVPNPVPFYLSTKGFGAFRNTFAQGEYDFTNQNRNVASHWENRFDCFYFYGSSLKEILNGYTELTGRPFLPPRWGLELGDADCYNKNGQTTPDVIELVADKYRDYDLPGGWILPNDGYGCGYTELTNVVEQLHQRGFYTGLWTESGVSQIAWEVGTAGTRACKLDVAWVGSGYLNALNACKAAYNGIEDNCDQRGFVWSVCGWAGTQRYSVVWSGDQYGGFEYIRFHIPTFIGSGLSGYNLASSDLDGIFGGSAASYARDIQWKTFIPVFYAMSGWAQSNKHPWNYGTNVMNISRQYLKLKMRLTPYMYTNCNTAYESGTPAVRAMVLEYPDDPVTYDKTTQYQFMSGQYMLVAPVYTPSNERDSIYFPTGKFIDYWDGTVYEGPQFLNDYQADLATCPVFIKSGAIIPLYTEMLYDGQYPKDTITFDVYPNGYSSFELYEDDGLTKEHRNGAFAKSLIESEGPIFGNAGIVTINVGESLGDYNGKPEMRTNCFEVHIHQHPNSVLLNEQPLDEYATFEELWEAVDGWYYDPTDRFGIVHVKTQPLPTDTAFEIKIDAITSKGENISDYSLVVYPNPARGTVYVETNGYELQEIKVYDFQGKLLKGMQINQNSGKPVEINLNGHPPGIYFIEIKSTTGSICKKVTKL